MDRGAGFPFPQQTIVIRQDLRRRMSLKKVHGTGTLHQKQIQKGAAMQREKFRILLENIILPEDTRNELTNGKLLIKKPQKQTNRSFEVF